MNGTWGYGKMTLLVEAKIFLYKIYVILCHNVNFDVTIMTSRRHFFNRLQDSFVHKSYLGKVTEGIFLISYRSKVKSEKVSLDHRQINGYQRDLHGVFNRAFIEIYIVLL